MVVKHPSKTQIAITKRWSTGVTATVAHPPIPHPVSCLEEAGRCVEVIKVGKFLRQGSFPEIIEHKLTPPPPHKNPAATKAGRDSEQVSHCSFLTPVPFPVASASDGALGLM